MALSAESRRALAAAAQRAKEQQASGVEVDQPQQAMSPMPEDPVRQARIQALLDEAARKASAQNALSRYVVEPAKGVGELAATVGSGMLLEPIAGIRGLYEAGQSALRGEEDPVSAGAAAVKNVQQGAYSPKTESGQRAVQALGGVMQPVERAIDYVGQAVTRETAKQPFEEFAQLAERLPPGQITNTLLEAAGMPSLSQMVGKVFAPTMGVATRAALELGIPGRRAMGQVAARQSQARADISSVEQDLDAMGIDPTQPIEDVRAALEARAEAVPEMVRENINPEQWAALPDAAKANIEAAYKGQAFDEASDLLGRLEQAKEGVQAGVERLYGEVGSRGAAIPPSASLIQDLDNRLKTYGLTLQTREMAPVRNAVDRVRKLVEREPVSPITLPYESRLRTSDEIPLSEINDVWKEINTAIRGTNSRGASRALSEVKGALDNFVEDAFVRDAISGDPTAVTRWREARGANQILRDTFDNDRVVAKLFDAEVTPVQMSDFVFGGSEAKLSGQTARVVRRIKDIVGADSDGFRALQAEAALRVLGPLMEAEPNFRSYIKRYDQLVKGNRPALREIFDQPTRDELYRLRRIADGARKGEQRNVFKIDIPRFLAVRFGSGLAKKAEQVRIARGIFEAIKEAEGQSRKRELVMNVLGYDPGRPMFTEMPTPTAMAGSAALVEQGEQAGEEERPK